MKTMHLSKIFSKNLALRDSARKVFALYVKENYGCLDFSNVELVSRSFANEFMKLEKKNNLNIEKKNMDEEVEFMFKQALEDSPKRSSNSDFKVGDINEVISTL